MGVLLVYCCVLDFFQLPDAKLCDMFQGMGEADTLFIRGSVKSVCGSSRLFEVYQQSSSDCESTQSCSFVSLFLTEWDLRLRF